MFSDFSSLQLLFTALLFIWTGFVRTGLGFGGAALGLPLLLLVKPEPLLWLPIIGSHLLFFTSITLRTRLKNVDWLYLKQSGKWILPAAIVGVLGLVKLPTQWILVFIYSITLFYSIIWILNRTINSHNQWIDRILLTLGGYIAGVSLTGAPLIVAVYLRNVAKDQLRNTLFVLWFILVLIKMSTFTALSVDLHLLEALILVPIAAIGHFMGLKAHEAILQNDQKFKQFVGAGLMVISVIGLINLTLT